MVGVLGWHLREGTTAQFDRLQILAKVITAFWPVRLQRSDKDFNRRFVVTIERVKFHDLHGSWPSPSATSDRRPAGRLARLGPIIPMTLFAKGRILMNSPRPSQPC